MNIWELVCCYLIVAITKRPIRALSVGLPGFMCAYQLTENNTCSLSLSYSPCAKHLIYATTQKTVYLIHSTESE